MKAKPIAIVADESQPFLTYLSILLDRMNLEVLPVSSAAEALELSRVTRPHLLTMDMVMADMDGLEALREIRRDKELSELPVIMISSYQDKHKQWEALSLGCVDVLDKPVDLRRLHKAIQRCDLYPGGRRRYLRAPFERALALHYKGDLYDAASLTLSERGILLRASEPVPKGSHVEVDLPLPSGEIMQVGGSVIYPAAPGKAGSSLSHGMAIKFDRLTKDKLDVLSVLVAELLIGDILTEQTEPVVRPD